MDSIHGIESLKSPFPASVVSIGNFDGLHKGHRILIRQLLDTSAELQVPSVVFTFHPHPLKILAPERDLRKLFLVDDLVEQLELESVDQLILQPFSRQFSEMTPNEFLEDCLIRPLNPKAIVVGHDFQFGSRREGNVHSLERFCQKRGIELNIVAPVANDDGVISSTRIRKAIAEGQVDIARSLLGRDFYVKGVVEYGCGRGKKIGFPTANVRLLSETLPKAGVYITTTLVNGKRKPSVTNIGKNPTFLEQKTSSPMRVESHLLNFNESVYGHEVRVYFHEFMREERKFDSVEQLIEQITKDVKAAKKYHSGNCQ